jgi:phosphoribosylanthranilate isomerase
MMIKVCGMREADNIAAVARSAPDMMGFIFCTPSPRDACAVSPEALDTLSPQTKRVGVFVDSPMAQVLETALRYRLALVQLHGAEPPEACALLRAKGLGVIKAFGIASPGDVERTAAYEGTCDYYLFDTAAATHGGTGRKFDHSVLAAYRGRTPFLLSGGLGPDDALALADRAHPLCAGYDINSRFETAPGVKDPAAVAKFIETVKNRQP